MNSQGSLSTSLLACVFARNLACVRAYCEMIHHVVSSDPCESYISALAAGVARRTTAALAALRAILCLPAPAALRATDKVALINALLCKRFAESLINSSCLPTNVAFRFLFWMIVLWSGRLFASRSAGWLLGKAD